jgi:hypothetical protein
MTDIESRLRAFRPRRPAPLPRRPRRSSLRGPLWLAAAAGLAAALVFAVRVRTPIAPPPPIQLASGNTLGALTTIVVERPDEFDAALARLSRESLPDVRQSGGALARLAKEKEY